jgi:hypothetical protein
MIVDTGVRAKAERAGAAVDGKSRGDDLWPLTWPWPVTAAAEQPDTSNTASVMITRRPRTRGA